MPELANQLKQTRYQKWQEWKTIQIYFFEGKTRSELRQIIQQPIISGVTDAE